MITLYTSKGCSRCAMVKQILDARKIEYRVQVYEDMTQEQQDEQTDDERQEVFLPERGKHAHSHKTERGNDGAHDDERFSVAERCARFVGKFPEKREQDEPEDVVRRDDDAVQDGVEFKHIIVDGLHDGVIGPPKQRDPPKRQRTKQSPFHVELHEEMITSKEGKSNDLRKQ